jgi:cobalt/nickel transport protein
MRFGLLLATIVLFSYSRASAHYHMLLPDRHSIKNGDKVIVTYQFGHPFEHELSDAEKPVRAVAYQPDGKAIDILPTLEKIELAGPDGKKVSGYRLAFQPSGRGDFTLDFESPPIWMADEKHFVRDVCRVVIHVETQKGWDLAHSDAKEFKLMPMTRPYGLRAGTIFQARIVPQGPQLLHFVEVERYNATPPKALPPDEHMTLSLKSDENGVATCTLPEPGWWAITATRKFNQFQQPATKERDGKPYPVVERATLWVPVDDKIPLKPVE